jgi:ATP-dependent RNA helicase DeaD
VGEDGREGTAAARSQHVVVQGPPDARTMTAAMRAGVERSREGFDVAAPACLVLVPTPEQALIAAERARELLGAGGPRVVPVTAPTRARRVLGAGPVAVVTGTPADLLALRRASAIRLDAMRTLVLVGLDELLAEGASPALEALLADLPADASRVATVDRAGDATGAFLEAHLRKARRITTGAVLEAAPAVTPRYLLTTAAGRGDALRLVLDALDPPSLIVVADSAEGERAAQAALARLGVEVDGLAVVVTRDVPATHAALLVLWEPPASADAMAAAFATRPVDAVVLLRPDELPAFLRAVGGAAEAWVVPARRDGAEGRVAAVHDALRAALAVPPSASELALLAPLLEAHDPVELAAATLRLYERALRKSAEVARAATMQASVQAALQAAPRPVARPAGAPALTLVPSSGSARQRVFLAVGKRDGARVGDIVGAIANEAGIPGDRIGQVALYESHATVEMSGEDAMQAVDALARASLRGRRLNARLDERGFERGVERAHDRGSERPGRERSARGAGRGAGRDERPARGGPPAGARPRRPAFGRDEGAPPRGKAAAPRGGSRGPARGGAPRAGEERRAFGDRSPRERTESRGEWAERGERLQRSRRPAPKPRPSDRDDD